MSTSTMSDEELLNVQIYVPELQVQKCLSVHLDEIVWDIKRKLFATLQEQLPLSFNYGLFLPPCDGRAGKFLLEDRPIRDYPFHDCVPYLELKYKKRVYKMLKLDEKQLKQLHSKANLKKFMEYVRGKNADKVEKMCTAGLDPNFHDQQGDTPLTLAVDVADNRDVIVALVGGGAHIDFRNTEGQTAMHKAAFMSSVNNVQTLLELGASPNYRDPLGLTPLYYNMLTADSKADVAEMLLKDAADLSVMDMHGNHEIHQACKNGLMHHVEHLLYYGADINAQNVNGNTPLHVCAVNNRPECARVLLFRGADPGVPNKQGQTALHVAHIVGNSMVAEVIKTHNPADAVPYRGLPSYNPRRRLTSSTLGRRRSLSQTSMCSNGSEYRMPGALRCNNTQMTSSPTTSRVTVSADVTATNAEYGTLRRYPPNTVNSMANGQEVNVPRILVIPRGTKGFGFILRGAKNADAERHFEPTPLVPALQFFEGVDMSGMAMKAGLRPGDFLLQINGIDVRAASHDQVVQLIHASGDTITLKVVTVDPSSAPMPRMMGGTLPSRRNRSTSRLPPPPPVRNPSTSLSSARGIQFLNQAYANRSSYTGDYAEGLYGRLGNATYTPLMPTKSVESLPTAAAYGYNDEQIRCASVKQRPSASRRISAAELEHLMVRQCQGTSQFQPIPYEQDSISSATGMKFNSVADMKRRKQRQAPSPQMPGTGLPRTPLVPQVPMQHYAPSLRSFNSSPDLQMRRLGAGGCSIDESSSVEMLSKCRSITNNSCDSSTTIGEYSRPYRSNNSRPKDIPPPPPPPPQVAPSTTASFTRASFDTHYATTNPSSQASSASQQQCNSSFSTVVPSQSSHSQSCDSITTPRIESNPSIASSSSSTIVRLSSGGTTTTPSTSSSTSGILQQTAAAPAPPAPAAAPPLPPPPPPPPPPPSVDMLRSRSSTSSSATGSISLDGKKTTTQSNASSSSLSTSAAGAPAATTGVGISAEALSNVRLKPASRREPPSESSVTVPLDFDADLRNALAKRRNKVSQDAEQGGDRTKSVVFSLENPPSVTTVSRYGGLSLRESVRENVPASPAKPAIKPQHSPPGFGTKKDSGYTSSRTSLEPSECGEEVGSGGSTTVTAQRCNDSITTEAQQQQQQQQLQQQQQQQQQRSNGGNVTANGIIAGVGPVNVDNTLQNSAHRVSLLSHQLEESYGNGSTTATIISKKKALRPPQQTAQAISEHDSVSITSSLSTLSGGSSSSDRMIRPAHVIPPPPPKPSRTPPIDYNDDDDGANGIDGEDEILVVVSGVGDDEDVNVEMNGASHPIDEEEEDAHDSGTGDSDADSTRRPADFECANANGDSTHRTLVNGFMVKPIGEWTSDDVAAWLDSLQLSEHRKQFQQSRISGAELLVCDRALFTRLGVTRIAHRQLIEQSLKSLNKQSSST